MADSERWLPVVGYEGEYEVSSLGRVMSLDRITQKGRKWRGRMMTPAPMPRGYLVVTLWGDGKQRTRTIHRLVLAAFVGPAPKGAETLHGDGDPANNRLENLQWGTHAENQADQLRHGTHYRAATTHCPSGHPYDEANTYVYPGTPHRACRKCRAANMRAWQEKNPDRARELARGAERRYRAKNRKVAA